MIKIYNVIRLMGGADLEFIAEAGSSPVIGASSISKITLRDEYIDSKNLETGVLSGVITEVSREGIKLDREETIPYSRIKEIRITAQKHENQNNDYFK